MHDGDLIDLDITGIAHGGVFVGRHEGRVVFVPDTLPGERVRARVTDTRKKAFWRADAVEVLEAAPERRRHVWAAADIDVAPEDRPGGAEFGHIELGHQRRLKERVIREALERVGKLDLSVDVRPAGVPGDAENADGTGWRTRLSLHVDDEGRIGPFAARSHRVIETPDLPLATAEVARAAAAVRGARPGRVDLVQPADGRVRVLARPDGDRSRPTPEVVEERVGERLFRVDAGGFWQVHRLAARTLTSLVRDELTAAGGVDPEGLHLDLYGGVGLFAATLAELGGSSTRVISVESDPRATEHAGENLAEWIGARAETARADRFVASLAAGASERERERLSHGVVLLDPPRAGAGREVVEGIAALTPSTVVYVACDPVALSRDLATFAEHGYVAANGIRGVDLFPHTHHVEAVVVLRR
ncbi:MULTISPECIES: class I SAM-dependent RNA methyltransferase [Microbacterium]|uniref:class I SAM-dependent RNA methyltransferase n=1 Tax=Microbacterium TaxID=33882 RepID=UPI00278AD5FF|nr:MULTISPECIES: TRAM domain-containing protein [Microbacterium]MDQ1074028.1 tRNA/tmRNA/rRNA uracil-C5-methylase (TrmA/RlmC/RlmD family) [Microbacterium sp. SORGH_AS_0969]MDQ1114255.1 tRNA/tmRNA/rRNA uracil-C5-methylase (TrmA/RlmC/RlmD family) [Microbacterium testaceum]